MDASEKIICFNSFDELKQEIIKDTVQVSKDRAEYYLDSASSLIHKKRRTNKE
jgi:hypothetical protein